MALQATVVPMEGRLLDDVEDQLPRLRAKALTVSRALREKGIPHAVIGGLAVATHVRGADQAAVRNTRDLDVLLKRADLSRASAALAPLGYAFREVMGIAAFVAPGGSFRDAVHLVWAGEKVRADYLYPAPELALNPPPADAEQFACLDLAGLVKMKLTSFRLKDRLHLQDLLEAGLITPELEAAVPADLRVRLQQVRDETERERLD